jgi:hypothetical protein
MLRFPLKIAGVDTFSVPAFIRAAKGLDFARLESVISGLRDDSARAGAWVALAELKLSTAPEN